MAVAEMMEHPMIDQAMAYHEMRDELESQFFDRWVIIHNSQLIGDFGSYDEAKAAVEAKGLSLLDCYIRQVGVEPPIILSYGR